MSKVVTGFDPEGRSAYFERNVREENADASVARAKEQGWTSVQASEESF